MGQNKVWDYHNNTRRDSGNACVTTLLALIGRWKIASIRLRRSVLFAVVTGQEKASAGYYSGPNASKTFPARTPFLP